MHTLVDRPILTAGAHSQFSAEGIHRVHLRFFHGFDVDVLRWSDSGADLFVKIVDVVLSSGIVTALAGGRIHLASDEAFGG